MAKEVEVKILDIDHQNLGAVLKSSAAKLKSPKTMYRRVNLDFEDGRLAGKGGWVRLRDEGDKITLTHKIHTKLKDGELQVDEKEVIVDNFEDALEFLRSIGLKVKTYQENYRENWILKTKSGTVEVALDQWPHVKPHVEIELEEGSEKAIEEACKILSLDFSSAINDDICPVYMAEFEIEDRNQLYDLEEGFRFDQPIKFKRRV